jgi:hypothetical protein
MLSEKVDRVGDLTKLEVIEPEGPWPRENVDRVGDGMFGRLCEEGIPLWPGIPRLQYRSPGSSILSLGLHSFCKVPSKSVGARNVRRDGKPLKAIDFASISVALLLSGLVNSQCRY